MILWHTAVLLDGQAGRRTAGVQHLYRIGLEALTVVGCKDLWANDDAMLAFVQGHLNDPHLTGDAFFSDSVAEAELAQSLVARNSFITRPYTWIYVEQIYWH